MKNNIFRNTILTLLLCVGVLANAQRGLKNVYFAESLTACPSANFNEFDLTIEWNPPMPTSDNIYRVELSDANGSFDSPRQLGPDLTDKNFSPKFTIKVSFPTDVAGDGYRVRVTSTSPYSQVVTEKPLSIYYITIKTKLKLNNGEPNIDLCPGETHELSVDNKSATAYRWYKDGKLIEGAKGPTYTVSKSGSYQVEVDYGEGYCTSSADTKSNIVKAEVKGSTNLKINGGVESAFICKGDGFTLVSTINNSELNYEWYKVGSSAPIASGKGMSTYDTPKGNSAVGTYYLKTYADGATCKETSNRIEIKFRQDLQVLPISIENDSRLLLPGKTKVLTASVEGAENPTYQWLKNGEPIAGATNKTYKANSSGVYNVKVTESGNGCSAFKKAEDDVVLYYPNLLKVSIKYKGYYADCKTDRVLLGVESIKAVISDNEEVTIPKTDYDVFTFQWKKNGSLISNNTSDLELKGSQNNGVYQLKVSYGENLQSDFSEGKGVNLLDTDNNIQLKASYTPGNGGGIIYLCKDFIEQGEELTVTGTLDADAQFKWYKEGELIAGANQRTYNATSFGNYYAEVSGGCDIKTNYLSLRPLEIKPNYLNVDKDNPSYDRVFLPYLETTLQTSIEGIDPDQSTIHWFKDGSPLNEFENQKSIKITAAGDYHYAVKPMSRCDAVTSREMKIRMPIKYLVEIDYLEGGEACNEVKDVKLGLKKLSAVIDYGTSTKTIDISSDYYQYYTFEWYKKNQTSNSYETIGTSASPTVLIISADDKESLTSYYLSVRSEQEPNLQASNSNSLQAGIEAIKPEVSLDESVSSSSFIRVDDKLVICQTGEYFLKADVNTDTPQSDLSYQWFLGGQEIVSATQSTLSVTQEGTYSVEVSGQKCRNIPSNQYVVRYFSEDDIVLTEDQTDQQVSDLDKIRFMEADGYAVRLPEGITLNNAIDLSGNAGIERIDSSKFKIKKSGDFKIIVTIGGGCRTDIFLSAEAIPLPSEIPTVVVPGSDTNRYWNLPPEYMDKPNVRVLIYTQDGVEVMSKTNFKNNSWPTELPKEFTGRSIIYLYIIEVDGEVKKRGTITLFQ